LVHDAVVIPAGVDTGACDEDGTASREGKLARPPEAGRTPMRTLSRSPAYARPVGVWHIRKMNAASTDERRIEEAKRSTGSSGRDGLCVNEETGVAGRGPSSTSSVIC
jgi:hypothetical protein